MKKTLLLFFILPMLAFGQGSVYYVDGISSTNSIVRIWEGSQAVVYNEKSAAERDFMLVDLASQQAQLADLPYYVTVDDFEILNGTVYFCGSELGIPYVGYFNIAGVFSGAEDFHYYAFNPGGTDYMVEVKKLEAFSVSGGKHIVATGTSKSGSTDCRFVMDLTLDANNLLLTYKILHNEVGIDYFDDVAVLDDYVATIDHKHQSEGHYLRYFDKPTSTASDIFSTTTYYTIHSYSGDLDQQLYMISSKCNHFSTTPIITSTTSTIKCN